MKQLQINISNETYEGIVAMCAALGKTISEWVNEELGGSIHRLRQIYLNAQIPVTKRPVEISIVEIPTPPEKETKEEV